jgi:DNA polymerase eta
MTDGRVLTDATNSRQLRNAGKVTLELYREESFKILHILERFGVCQRASIDEAYIDLTPSVDAIYRQWLKTPPLPPSASSLSTSSTPSSTTTTTAPEKVSEPTCDSLSSSTSSTSTAATSDVANDEKAQKSVIASVNGWYGMVLGGDFEATTPVDIRLMLASKILQDIRQTVYDELKYTASAGLAHCKKFAKLIASRNKPNGQTVLFAAPQRN